MRSQAITLGPDKLVGLLSDEEAPYDSPGLDQCFNLRATENGLEAPRSLSNPGTLPSAVSWPFPQFFRTGLHTLALYVNKIYLVNESTWAYTDITPTGIVSGHMWTCADMHGAWVLTNGSCVVWTSTPTRPESPTTSPILSVATTPTVSCCCRCRGQVFFGGTPVAARVGIWEHLGPNFVFWTDVGGGDMYLPWSTMDYAGTDIFKDDVIKSMIQQNLLGHMPMPTPGQILRVEALDDIVMVYSEDSINALKPEIIPNLDNRQVFRLVELHPNNGIKQRGFVAGDNKRHYYVTDDGYLWMITPKLEPQRLGFQHLFSGATGTWIGSYDETENEAYFSEGLNGYIITDRGVSALTKYPTSLLNKNGTLYAPSKDIAGGPNFIIVTTSGLRFGTEARVTLAMVEAGMRGITGAYVTPHPDYGSGFTTRNKTFRFNSQNVCFPRTTAPQLQFSITGTVAGAQKIDYLRYELQYPDRRFRRGIEGGS